MPLGAIRGSKKVVGSAKVIRSHPQSGKSLNCNLPLSQAPYFKYSHGCRREVINPFLVQWRLAIWKSRCPAHRIRNLSILAQPHPLPCCEEGGRGPTSAETARDWNRQVYGVRAAPHRNCCDGRGTAHRLWRERLGPRGDVRCGARSCRRRGVCSEGGEKKVDAGPATDPEGAFAANGGLQPLMHGCAV